MFGIVNVGATCWLNTYLQILMSIPQYVHFVRNNPDDKHILNLEVQKIIKWVINYSKSSNIPAYCPDYKFVEKMRQLAGDKNSMEKTFLDTFINTLDAFPKEMFIMKMKNRIQCKCGKINDKWNAYEQYFSYVDYKLEYAKQLIEKCENIDVLQDSNIKICDECKTPGNKYLLSQITDAGNVLMLICNKNSEGAMQKIIKFGDRKIYRLVATAEHSGNQSGGHYFARIFYNKCYRVSDDYFSELNNIIDAYKYMDTTFALIYINIY